MPGAHVLAGGPPAGVLRPGAPEPGAPPKDPLVGQLVAGRFLVTEPIGAGGVGKVYKALQVDLDRPVAIKVLRQEAAADRDQTLRFHREARTASKLNHPGCVTMYDFGEWKNRLYLAMEFIDGRTLAEIIKKEYPLATDLVVDLLAQVCDALDAAHRLGLLHRDLKPENILVRQDASGHQQVKLVDFGLAVIQDTPVSERLTQDGSIFGTPAFMSPEQCRGMTLDARSDIYSLGCILYEMLAGTPPFEAENPIDLMTQQIFSEPPPPSSRAMGSFVHARLETLAMKALAKDPADRPQSALDFRSMLLEALSDQPDSTQAHRVQVAPLTRTDRANRAGLPRTPASTHMERPTMVDNPPFILLDWHEKSPGQLMALLGANGFSWHFARTIGQAALLVAKKQPAGLLLNMDPDPDGAQRDMVVLTRHLAQGRLLGLPLVVIGPDEDLPLMEQAVSLGIYAYAPRSALLGRLPKLLRRLQKRARRKR